MSKELNNAIKLLEEHNYQVIKKGSEITHKTTVGLTEEENAYLIKEGGSKWKRGEILKKALIYYKNKGNLDLLINRLVAEIKKVLKNIPTGALPKTAAQIKDEIASLKAKPILSTKEKRDIELKQAEMGVRQELMDRFSKMQESKNAINETVEQLRKEQLKIHKSLKDNPPPPPP